jgi:hypothetical protein
VGQDDGEAAPPHNGTTPFLKCLKHSQDVGIVSIASNFLFADNALFEVEHARKFSFWDSSILQLGVANENEVSVRRNNVESNTAATS